MLCMTLCFVSASCRSSGGNAEFDVIPEMTEFEGCSLSVPCMVVTPENLDEVPEPVLEMARKHCGKAGTAVVLSSVRPRYFRLLREQRRLLLGSLEINPSRETVYLCVLSGLGEFADSVPDVRIENPNALETWNLGVFVRRYPELAARLNELPPGDGRIEAAEPAAQELLKRGSTRVLLEKSAGGNTSDALEEAKRAEQEQIGVLEDILNAG